jgi:hypothetical protein
MVNVSTHKFDQNCDQNMFFYHCYCIRVISIDILYIDRECFAGWLRGGRDFSGKPRYLQHQG